MPVRGGRSAPRPCRPLRVGSHNLGGVRSGAAAPKLHAALLLWAQLRLDVVCIQETHLSTFGDRGLFERRLHAAAGHLHVAPWRVVSFRNATLADPCAGVAILVRSDLIASGRLVAAASPLLPGLAGDQPAVAASSPPSRSLSPPPRSPSPGPAADAGPSAAAVAVAAASGVAASVAAAAAAAAVAATAAAVASAATAPRGGDAAVPPPLRGGLRH
jgi:hypothetical protein